MLRGDQARLTTTSGSEPWTRTTLTSAREAARIALTSAYSALPGMPSRPRRSQTRSRPRAGGQAALDDLSRSVLHAIRPAMLRRLGNQPRWRVCVGGVIRQLQHCDVRCHVEPLSGPNRYFPPGQYIAPSLAAQITTRAPPDARGRAQRAMSLDASVPGDDQEQNQMTSGSPVPDLLLSVPPRSRTRAARRGTPEAALREIPDGARVVIRPLGGTPLGLLA